MKSAFTDVHREQLLDDYPEPIVEQIVDMDNWDYAPVPGADDEYVAYVDIKPVIETDNPQTFLYVPGFVEGIVNKASMAAELASRGHRVILPGQNRAAGSQRATDGRTATEQQADNYLSVTRHAGLEDAEPTVLAHSYGGLVFDAMSRMSLERDARSPFGESSAFLLTSAGLIEGETNSRLFAGWLRMMASEMKKDQQDFPDVDGSTGKASLAAMTANVSRTVREAREMVGKVIRPELANEVGRLIVVDYAEDKLFPAVKTASHVGRLMAHGATWLTPFSIQTYETQTAECSRKVLRGGRGAVHDDEQLNPSRVADALEHAIRHSA